MKKIGYSQFLIGGIRVPVDAREDDIVKAAKDKMKREGVSTSPLHFRLFKKSVDARRRDDIRFECTVLVEAESREIPRCMNVANAASIFLRVNSVTGEARLSPAARQTFTVPRSAFATVSFPGRPVFIRSICAITR